MKIKTLDDLTLLKNVYFEFNSTKEFEIFLKGVSHLLPHPYVSSTIKDIIININTKQNNSNGFVFYWNCDYITFNYGWDLKNNLYEECKNNATNILKNIIRKEKLKDI